MSRDALAWCLVAVTAIAVAAIVALIVRNTALGRRKYQAEKALKEELAEAQRHLGSVQGELESYKNQLNARIRDAEEAAEAGTAAVVKAAANFLQSLGGEQMTKLEGIQAKYGNHPVLADLLEVTHANAQMQRKAQGIAVLCGAPVGRRSRPGSVYDVVRNAKAQIKNFRRVEVMHQTGIALKASHVSPVALAVAELLDNAASFSQPDAPIEVTFNRVQQNLCIVIDDAGVGMNDEERQRASALLSGEYVPRLSQLGNQPKFGFPLIGLLAKQYKFRVDVTGISRYGGVRAVVLLPEELWTKEEPAPSEIPAPVSIVRDEEGAASPKRTANGLPKRESRATVSEGQEQSQTDHDASRVSRRRGALSALQKGTISGRTFEPPASIEGSQDA
jgi:hypothetical protein